MRALLGGALLAISLAVSAWAQEPKIVSEDHMIPSTTPGVELFVRNKRAAGNRGALLFVHGATYPAETAFDLPIEGVSMMDMFAEAGFDVFCVDMRNYGRSTRVAAMDQPPAENGPLTTSEDAAADIGAAVDYVLKLRGLEKLDLMGWSWGTSIAGNYAAHHNEKIDRLVLYAPAWTFSPPAEPSSDPIAAYRTVEKENARKRWVMGLTEAQKQGLIPEGVFDAWWNATLATDPKGAETGKLRAPNGVFDEFVHYWRAGKPLYDPADIKVPTLLIHAEWDADLPTYMAHGVFVRLTNAPYKRLVELGQGTHTVMLEKNRKQFFSEIANFLSEKDPMALK